MGCVGAWVRVGCVGRVGGGFSSGVLDAGQYADASPREAAVALVLMARKTLMMPDTFAVASMRFGAISWKYEEGHTLRKTA